MLEREGRLPARVVACVGGGSNAIGIFAAFIADEQVELIGVEAGGEGIDTPRHGAPLTVGGRAGHPARLALGGDAGRGGPDPRGALGLRRASTTRAPARSTRTCATAAARATSRSPTPTRSPRSASSRAWRASSRRSRPRTRSPGCSRSPRASSTSSACPAAATRISPRSSAMTVSTSAATGVERIAEAFAGTGKRAALMPYLMGGFPTLERVAADRRGVRGGRRRRDRARRALLRPARRRAGDPRRRHPRAGRRGEHRRRARGRARRSRQRAGGADVLREHGLRPGRRGVRRAPARRRAPAG